MNTEQEFVEVVPDALDGQRVDRVVSLMADISRSDSGRLVAAGAVTVDGRPVGKASIKVATGQTVCFRFTPPDDALVADPSVEVPVVHADDDVIVVDKPAGLVVHPGAGVRATTMVNGLLARFPELTGVGEPDRPGIVHRLDRGTSGLLAVARSQRAYESLVGQLADRSVERRYRCLVAGHVEADGGLIDAPLGRSPRQATIRAVVADGRPARTRYEVRRRGMVAVAPGEASPPDTADPGEPVSELSCRLETGRTHQIRAHLAAIGHPVVGDPDYGGPSLVEAPTPLRRPFLHAEELAFRHPVDGTEQRFTAELPADLTALLAALRPPDPVTSDPAEEGA
ncbi:MAG: RluA family pseudouridine synthase [Actinomycetota bacterium]